MLVIAGILLEFPSNEFSGTQVTFGPRTCFYGPTWSNRVVFSFALSVGVVLLQKPDYPWQLCNNSPRALSNNSFQPQVSPRFFFRVAVWGRNGRCHGCEQRRALPTSDYNESMVILTASWPKSLSWAWLHPWLKMMKQRRYIILSYVNINPAHLSQQDLSGGISTRHQVLRVGKLQTAKRSEPRNSWNWYNLT